MKRWFATLVLGLAMTYTGAAQENVLKVQVTADKDSPPNTPLCIPLSLSPDQAKFDEVFVSFGTSRLDSIVLPHGQLTAPSITTESIKPVQQGQVRRDLHVILPVLSAGEPRTLHVHLKETKPQAAHFAWTESLAGEYLELVLKHPGTTTNLLRYMKRPYDTSSKQAREKTYKVFHHLYDTAGKRLVTNGGNADDNAGDPKKLLYPHHRGIMYGFNQCSYGADLKKKADTWHCTGDTHVAHERHLNTDIGHLLGRHRVQLGWFGEQNERFAHEERELTAYNLPGGTLVEFVSRLKPTAGRLKVDGDPQHAGFQFRAHNDVAVKTASQTYFLHPDGKGEMGKERNWPQDKTLVDLPWYAMSFVLDGQRYTVCYLNHPHNPKETRFSERSYGRIGGYFQREVTASEPLVVHYRLWLQNGEMTQEQAQALQSAFASPPKAVVK